MPPFQHHLQVQQPDIDALGHVNNVVYVRWVQEVAAAHWEHVAPSELRTRYLWVVLRHEIDYKNPAFIQDEIVGTTWVGEHHGARFERFVTLSAKENNKVLVQAKTTWCMLDAGTMRPTRITAEVLRLL